MPVNSSLKLAFCHIPRTGGVSVTNALEMFGVKDKHFKASYRNNYPNYKLFTIIRTYDDRIKSAFGWKVPAHHNHPNIESLVEQTKKLASENISLMLKPNEYFLDCEVDFMIRFEHLEDDLNAMLTGMGHKTVKLIKINSFR